MPERWSVTDHVRWKLDVPGRGWSSPIVWGNTVFLTSALNGKPFKQPTPGLYGNDYIVKATEDSNAFIVWRHPRASGYTPSGLIHHNRAYLVHDTGIMVVLDALTGKEIYKVRIGGGGQTFSASPVAAGDRILLLTEEGLTFVLAAGDVYREMARNDLAEMSLASPAIAGGAVDIRTESKLYKIQ